MKLAALETFLLFVLQVRVLWETSGIKQQSSRRYRSPRCSPGFSLSWSSVPHRCRLISEAFVNGFVPPSSPLGASRLVQQHLGVCVHPSASAEHHARLFLYVRTSDADASVSFSKFRCVGRAAPWWREHRITLLTTQYVRNVVCWRSWIKSPLYIRDSRNMEGNPPQCCL